MKNEAFTSLNEAIAYLKSKGIINEPCGGSPFVKLSYDKVDKEVDYEYRLQNSEVEYDYSAFKREALKKKDTLATLHNTM